MGILDALLDASVVLSFDRTGFARHARAFDPADLDADLSDRVAVVTGANSGIGRATAWALASRGAELHLLCRSRARGIEARDTIRHSTRNPKVTLHVVDVSSLPALRTFCATLPVSRVDLLVNNAGVLPDSFELTADGLERTLATNLVGPFLLTELLLPRLAKSSDPRVVSVSSGGMYAHRLRVEALDPPRTGFDGVTAYARTKRALVVLNELWAVRHPEITFAAMHPGWAATPAVRASLPRFYALTRPILRTAKEGADTVIWLASARCVRGRSGLFWFDRAPRATHLLPGTRERESERAGLWDACRRWAGLS